MLDFNTAEVNQLVTQTLLRRDFDLEVAPLDDRLCPPIPNRLGYVRFIESLVGDTVPRGETVVGLDIGTGPYAIYALLLARRNPSWQLCATDIDPTSLAHARKTVKGNALGSQITLHDVDSQDEPLIPHTLPEDLAGRGLCFTMTNPPFYSSFDDMQASAALKQLPPSGVCTGSRCEMVYPGGEVAFTLRQLEEGLAAHTTAAAGSTGLRSRWRWYTTLLGKLSSVEVILQRLRAEGVTNYAVHDLVTGRTKRWIVAWSLLPDRPRQALARGSTTKSLAALLPPVCEHRIATELRSSLALARGLTELLDELKIAWSWIEPTRSLSIEVHADTWSRAARRLQARTVSGRHASPSGETCEVLMRVAVDCCINRNAPTPQLHCRWTYGLDEKLWESFVGKLRRHFQAARPDPGRGNVGLAERVRRRA